MTRAEAALASARPDSIKGLAQSIAKPAYRRLLTAEPLLRRAVPVLIVAFLVTICVGAFSLMSSPSMISLPVREALLLQPVSRFFAAGGTPPVFAG